MVNDTASPDPYYEIVSVFCRPEDSPAIEEWISGTYRIPVLVTEGHPCQLSFSPPSANPVERILLEEGLRSLGALEIRIDAFERKDWQELWKEQGFRRFVVGGTLTVLPAWDQDPVPHPSIRIDPKLAFGTGWHETTFCVLERILDKISTTGGAGRILDFGAGTGILGIAAMKLDPRATLIAIDNDPYAVEATAENLRLNRMEERGAVSMDGSGLASGGSGPPARFDLILANVTGGVILAWAESLWGLLSENGWLVFSGISKEEAAPVEELLRGLGPSLREFPGERYNTYCLEKKGSHG
ncbi:MAG: 50S ribosomal protein L11 methyltransferase [Nitrospirae bacterium]|nr:50S ribosomal protein L11 methyltransferase [Nitrospirota bacterium]MCL5285280.1 50S ribosomal protein L11 methyltransferase [Nitrospirota bacterium]